MPDRGSLRAWPGSSALVESLSSRRMPSPDDSAPMRAEVGEAAVDRREVELEVARVQDRALRRVEGGGEALRHRVGDRDELDLARPDAPALAVAHRDQLGAVEQPGLLDAVAGQAQRQRRAVDRERQLAQQVAEAPHVVLVAVRDDRPVDAVGVVAQVGEVGQHQVDAEHVELGEHQTDVEQQDAAVDLDAGAVAPDLAQPAEERDLDGISHGRPPAPSSTSATAATHRIVERWQRQAQRARRLAERAPSRPWPHSLHPGRADLDLERRHRGGR